MVINHNMMAMNAARNLSQTYGKLSTSVQRLSSGLRINTAADDAAGLAIREMMRADIATTQQGIRNAADAISMIQTADGGLAVIDEKLTRMKELAEQAATGTYTTIQREIINSEYQAMAAEIDRIANSTNFNGIKLLDGSVSNQHGGQGIKIHFGVSNNEAEDYYFINMGDARATSSTGLRVGGDAKNDIWGQGAAGAGPMAGPGCCTAGFSSLDGKAGFISGETFSFGYNWDWQEDDDTNLLTGKYLAGRYTVGSGDSLQNLIDKVNLGSLARVGIAINSAALAGGVAGGSGVVAVCVGDESYYWGNASAAEGYDKKVHDVKINAASAEALQVAYNSAKGGNPAVYASGSTTMKALEDAGIKLGGKLQSTDYVSAGVDTATVNNPASADAAVDLVVSAYNSALNAKMDAAGLISGSAVSLTVTSGAGAVVSAGLVDDVLTNTLISASAVSEGVLEADGSFTSGASSGSFTVSAGIWADSAGNWTTSSDVANALGMSKVTAKVDVTADNSAATAVITVTIGGKDYKTTTGTLADGDALASAVQNAIANDMGKAQAARPGEQVRVSGTEAGFTKGDRDMTPDSFKAEEAIKPVGGVLDKSKQKIQVDDNVIGGSGKGFTASALAEAINENADSEFWAMTETRADGTSMVYVFAKEGGKEQNSILACEVGGRDAVSRSALNAISFENVETGEFHSAGTNLSLGGQDWGSLSPVQTKSNKGNEVWNLTLNGRDVGRDRDLWIANPGEITTPGLDDPIINGMDRDAFVEIQNAENGNWKGAEVRTQSSAQESLDALTDAIVRKDKVRADLGAMQNRLENTITNLEIQAENLQASESRISDVDVAKEMTEFTKNNVMVQAAVGMLAQANSMSQMALSLLG
jgi:flagellin